MSDTASAPFSPAQRNLHEIATRLLILSLLGRADTDGYRVLEREFESRRTRLAESN